MRPPTGIGTLLREGLYASHGPPRAPPNAGGSSCKSNLPHTQSSSLHTSASALRSGAARAANTSQTTFARRLTAFLTDTVFRTARLPASPHTSGVHPSTLARSAGRTFATHSGPCLRHAAVPHGAGTSLNTGTTVGLGSVRKFSSGAGRSVFDNVVRNAPVWARAAGDEARDEGKRAGKGGVAVGRFDARRVHRQVRRGVRKAAGVPPKGMDEYLPKAAAELVPTPATVTLLSVPLEPVFRLSSSTASTLLPAACTLRDLQSSLTAHGSRLSQLESKLRAAGAWDAAASCSFEEDGARMVIKWVTPRGHEGVGWKRRDVEQALDMWPGEERWFEIDEYEGTEMLPPPSGHRSAASQPGEGHLEAALDAAEDIIRSSESFTESLISSRPTGASTPYSDDTDLDSPFGFQSSFAHDAVTSSLRLPSPELPASEWSSLHSSVAEDGFSPGMSLRTLDESLVETDGSDSPSWISYQQALRGEPEYRSQLWDELTSSESEEDEWASESDD